MEHKVVHVEGGHVYFMRVLPKGELELTLQRATRKEFLTRAGVNEVEQGRHYELPDPNDQPQINGD